MFPGTWRADGLATVLSLDLVFEPSSIAVYGASSRRSGALGNTLLANAAASGIPITVVHPQSGEVAGHRAHPSMADIGGVDLALVSVPADAVPSAVADAAGAGTGACVVLSSGFGESGPDGKALEAELVAIAEESGMTLIGPNCMGIISHLKSKALLNASYFWDVPDRPGGLSFVSQSGAMGGMFLAEVRNRKAGLARFLSIGNAADIDIADALVWLADDSSTSAIGVFVEGINDGPAFITAASRAAANKPVIALKGGRHASGAVAAASHTGSLAGTYGAVRAAFLRTGIVETTSTEEFFDRLFTTDLHVRANARVVILTVSGGPSVIAADAITDHGLQLAQLTHSTRESIRKHLPAFAAVGNPVDVTPQCPPAVMQPVIGTLYDDPNIDAVVVIDCGLDVAEFGTAVSEAAARTGVPTVAYLLDVPTVSDIMRTSGIHLVNSPERAVAAVAASQTAS